jgi:hypothetical protein
MKLLTVLLAFLATGFIAAAPSDASAVVYCKYIGYPKRCVARAGVVLRSRPIVRAARPGIAPGVYRPVTPMNWGGPVDQPGRR